jgi:hypothetical protein
MMIYKNNSNSSPATGLVGVTSGSSATKPNPHFENLSNNISAISFMQSLAQPQPQRHLPTNANNTHQNHKTTVSPIPTVRQQPHGTNNQELASLNKCVQSNCECDVYTPTTGNRSDSPSKQLRNCSDCKHSWMLHCKKLTIE